MKNIVIGILITVIVYLFFFFKNEMKDKELVYSNNTKALTEQISIVKNKLGETSAKVTTLQATNSDLLDNIVIKDSTINRLKTLVDEYKNDIDDGGSITVLIDTVYIQKTVAISDSNTFTFKNKWIDLSGIISDSLKFNLLVNNDYSVVLGYEKDGWFRKKPYTLVTNKNPYSKIANVRSYQVVVPKPRWSFGVTGGFGVVRNGGQLESGLGVMFGINYRLL